MGADGISNTAASQRFPPGHLLSMLTAPCLLLTALLYITALPSVTADIRGDPTPLFSFAANSSTLHTHYQFGLEVGQKFRSQITSRVANSTQLQHSLLPFYATPQGRAAYNEFLATHQRGFPKYMAEIEGMAEGSGVPFATLLIQNLALEYGSVSAEDDAQAQEDKDREDKRTGSRGYTDKDGIKHAASEGAEKHYGEKKGADPATMALTWSDEVFSDPS